MNVKIIWNCKHKEDFSIKLAEAEDGYPNR